MACQPFKPPPLSRGHDRHLTKFLNKTKENQLRDCEKAFTTASKSERDRYLKSVDDHCCYCGRKEPSLDLDHFFPKKHANHPKISDERLSFYKWLARVNNSVLSGKLDFDGAMSGGEKRHYAHDALTPKNWVPSCIYCNRRQRMRMVDDTMAVKGKGSDFPILAGGEPALFHPADMSWRQLMDIFTFRDLTDSFASAEPRQQNLCLTLIMPSVTALTTTDSKAALQAAAVIDLFGLNRLVLCQERHRQRLILRAYLNSLSISDPPPQAKPTASPVISLLSRDHRLSRASTTIADIVSAGPHRLAMLDMLRTWLGDQRFQALDLDRFMRTVMR